MGETLESLKRKREGCVELNSVVLTMKAIAAANVGQYERAVVSLKEYYSTISKGITIWFSSGNGTGVPPVITHSRKRKKICVIVFGSDQGLVGRFNDLLAEFTKSRLEMDSKDTLIWATGERVFGILTEMGLTTEKLYSLPNSVNSITSLVEAVLIQLEEKRKKGEMEEFHIFHNAPLGGSAFQPVQQRLLPLDLAWEKELTKDGWSNNNLPEVTGNREETLEALLREYIFVSLYKACAESLASENASRLVSMQRAERNISDLLNALNQEYNLMRQTAIDEELFDVVSGFEALKTKT